MNAYAILVSVFISYACALPRNKSLELEPWQQFCHGLSCPKYTVLEKYGDFEHREYEPSEWVTSQIFGSSFEDSRIVSFEKLFAYISGENDQRTTRPITTPNINHIYATHGIFFESNYLLHLFVPPHSEEEATPIPTDKNLKIVKYPSFQVYVRSYGDFVTEETVRENYFLLKSSLRNASLAFGEEDLLSLVYDSPDKPAGRHNEVMVFVK